MKNKKGQAVFEFIVFVPFFLLVLASMIVIGSAINGSINQQKAVRGYYYNRLFNNSHILDSGLLNQLKGEGIELAGILSIGWRDRMDGVTPVAPCYELPKLLVKGVAGDVCDEKPVDTERSQLIRLKTMYGVCANTYNLGSTGPIAPEPMAGGRTNGCLLLD